MKVQVKHKNKNVWKKLEKQYGGKGVVIAVGIPKATEQYAMKHPISGIPIVDIAFWNEFGTEIIPSRPFLKTGGKIAQEELAKRIKVIIREVNAGRANLKDELQEVGATAAKIIQVVIEEFSEPPNAPSTIQAKGTNNPLVDQGHLKRAITYQVRDKK